MPVRAVFRKKLGKKASALYFAHNVLPEVVAKAKMLQSGDKSALEIPLESFSTI